MGQPESYVSPYPPFVESNRGKHIATQDFLQPLERVNKEEQHLADLPSAGLTGNSDILQLSMRNNHSRNHHHQQQQQPQQQQQNSGPSWSALATNRYPQLPSLDINSKRQNPSDDDENDSDYNRKRPRKREDDSSKSGDGKLTPRSKHSATEQRRRSKINDRFQMLRHLLPRGDQKKDKASFLLEVIDYVQSLQEKVQKYEAMERGGKTSEVTEYKSSTPVSSELETRDRTAAATACSSEIMEVPKPESWRLDRRPSSSKQEPEVQEETRIVEGSINVSAAYSQRLLETLTAAFKSAGVDLSQANISVRIELGDSTAKTKLAG